VGTELQPTINPLERRVLLVVHNPAIPQAGGGRLTETFGWNDPGDLAAAFIEEISDCSYNTARFILR
jgi:hypothetical protein